MDDRNELLISARDAEALALVLREHKRADPSRADWSDELADLLIDSRVVAPDHLPANRVAMHSTVTYVEEPGAVSRTVTLVYPQDANPGVGHISVLSPIGLALIGRKRGNVTALRLPNRRSVSIRIVEVSRHTNLLRQAA
jgi:regulator of nucleoside diphosphate kinase